MAERNIIEKKSRELRERSSSSKNIRNNKEARVSEGICMLGRINQMNTLTTKPSREYNKVDYELTNQKNNSKTLNDNNDYIKSLYKKYLGKENQSDRKTKTDTKIQKNLFKNEEAASTNRLQPKQRLESTPIFIKNSHTQQSNCRDFSKKQQNQLLTGANKLIKNKNLCDLSVSSKKDKNSLSSREVSQQNNFYNAIMNEETLQIMGNSRSSLVRCMKNICRAKKLAKMK